MDILSVIFTLIAVLLLAYIIKKKAYPVITLLVSGVLILIIYTIATGKSVLGDATVGNNIIDVFEYAKNTFISSFTGTGIVLMPVVGFATYMNHIGASKMLANIAIKPFKNVKNPYFLVLVSVIIGGLFRLAIPSQTGLIALLMVTIYPVMLAAGMSKISAGAACVLGTAFDWGPACSTTALVLRLANPSAPLDQAEFFIGKQLWVFAIALVLSAIVSMIVNKYFDKKQGYELGSDAKEAKLTVEEGEKLPGIYAILPILPLAVMLIFSKAVIGTVVISAFGATLISFFIAIIFEIIRKKGLLSAFTGTKEMFVGMGTCYTDMITLISSASVFAGAVQQIGGFTIISDWIIGSGLPGFLLIILLCALAILMTMAVGSSIPATTTFSPFVYGIATAAKVMPETVLLPFEITIGFSRGFSPISACNVFTSKFINVDSMDLIKRNVLPFITAIVSVLITALIGVG